MLAAPYRFSQAYTKMEAATLLKSSKVTRPPRPKLNRAYKSRNLGLDITVLPVMRRKESQVS